MNLSPKRVLELHQDHNIPKSFNLKKRLEGLIFIYEGMLDDSDILPLGERRKSLKKIIKKSQDLISSIEELPLESQRDIFISHTAIPENSIHAKEPIPEYPGEDYISYKASQTIANIKEIKNSATQTSNLLKGLKEKDSNSKFLARYVAIRWIRDIYQDATGCKSGISTGDLNEKHGPFFRFLKDISQLLKIEFPSDGAMTKAYRDAIKDD